MKARVWRGCRLGALLKWCEKGVQIKESIVNKEGSLEIFGDKKREYWFHFISKYKNCIPLFIRIKTNMSHVSSEKEIFYCERLSKWEKHFLSPLFDKSRIIWRRVLSLEDNNRPLNLGDAMNNLTPKPKQVLLFFFCKSFAGIPQNFCGRVL